MIMLGDARPQTKGPRTANHHQGILGKERFRLSNVTLSSFKVKIVLLSEKSITNSRVVFVYLLLHEMSIYDN